MSVIAKFFVQTITEHAHAKGQKQIVMAPVSRGEENKEWSKYTPSGRIEMSILNEAAAEQFELGKEYLVRFSPAEIPLDELQG
jgi:hypothetical protein